MKDGLTVRDILDRFDRLEEKLDRRLIPLEGRMDKVENNQSRFFGAIGIVAVFGSAIANYVMARLMGKS